MTLYDQMQKTLRDKGWIETEKLLDQGIAQGCALEIGPGPGYLGLEAETHARNNSQGFGNQRRYDCPCRTQCW